jgi:acylphosphatase
MNEIAVEVRVTGHVQGVGFRWACQQEAVRRGVRGWVRNEPDESVAARFEGDRGPVEAMVEWCRSGPPGAHVDTVDSQESVPEGAKGFRVAY